MPTKRKFLLIALLLMASAALIFFYGFIAVPDGVGTAGFVVFCFSITLICAYPLGWSKNKSVTVVITMVSAENAIFSAHTAWLAHNEHHNVIFIAIIACVVSLITTYLSVHQLLRRSEPFDPRSNAWAFQDHFGGRTPPKSD